MSGDDLLRKIRANPRLAATPFLLLTAERNAEDMPCAAISRPFNAQMLQSRLWAVLRTG